ncbi:MAG: NAD(P)-binding protein [Candidatus Omnitrophota bacterium]
MKKIVVLGGGSSGLSVAWQIALSKQGKVDIYEKSDRAGGVCGYHDFNGIKLDYGPHKIYSILPGLMDTFKSIPNLNLKEVKKKHRIIMRGATLDYPVKMVQMFSLFSLPEILAVGFSVFNTIIKSPFLKEAVSYEDYCIGVFGKKIYEVVFKPLAEKTWGNPKLLSADIAKTRIPTKSVFDLIARMIGLKRESVSTDAEVMLYPARGFSDIYECMAENIKAMGHTIHLGTKPIKFIRTGKKVGAVVFDDKSEIGTDLVISSIPLVELVAMLFPEDKDIAKERFIHMRHSVIAYLLVDRPKVMEDHWDFCTDKDILFSRISEQKLLANENFPKDKTVVACDFTCDGESSIWQEKGAVIAKRCVQDLERLKVLKKESVISWQVIKIPSFYPVYEIGYENKLRTLIEKINRVENVICTGRLGLCGYNNVDHGLDMGIFCAKELAKGKSPANINNALLERARTYRIVD